MGLSGHGLMRRHLLQVLCCTTLLAMESASSISPEETLDLPAWGGTQPFIAQESRPLNPDSRIEPGIRLARAESRQLRRSSVGFKAGAESDLQPSAEPGLQFESDVEIRVEGLQNISLGERPRDDVVLSEQEIQLGLSYRLERFLAFGEINLLADQVHYADDTPNYSETALERGEMWLLFKRAFDTPFSLQVGRQNYVEPRLWWWDDDLDSVRVYYQGAPLRAYLGVAEQIARVATNEDFIEPDHNDVKRLLGHVGWALSDRFLLNGFLLGQRDDSGRLNENDVVEDLLADESDGNLVWAGIRGTGSLDLSRYGRLHYRGDHAAVTGDEPVMAFEENGPGLNRVTGILKQDVRAWAIDLGTTWTLPFAGNPELRFIYAYGSGDNSPDDGTDRNFRQTGLQDQDEEFRDYGVVLRPELSNLQIATLTVDLPVLGGNRLSLGYHLFRQVSAAPFLRDTVLDVEPTGESRDIGDEFSLVLQVRGWEDLELDFIAGSFKAGSAFGESSGNRTNRVYLKLIYEF